MKKLTIKKVVKFSLGCGVATLATIGASSLIVDGRKKAFKNVSEAGKKVGSSTKKCVSGLMNKFGNKDAGVVENPVVADDHLDRMTTVPNNYGNNGNWGSNRRNGENRFNNNKVNNL